MKKKLLVGIVFFSIGIGVSLLLDSFLRRSIFDLYQWSTNNKITFLGKNWHFFPSSIFIISFTFSMVILGLGIISQETGMIIKSLLLYAIIFSLALIAISSLDANRLLTECTACQDGTRRIRYNDIDYGLILGITSFIATVPTLIYLVKRRKFKQHR